VSLKFPEFEIVGSDGKVHLGGCLPRQSKCGKLPGVPVWDGSRSDCPIVPPEQWKNQTSLRSYEWNDVDQNGHPACCLASLANIGEFFMAMHGREKTPLDWYKAWKYLSGGYGGVALDTALRYVMDPGFPLKDGSGHLRVKEVFDIPNVQALFSAPMRGVPLWYGASGHAEAGMTIFEENTHWQADIRGTWGKDYGQDGWYPRSYGYIAAGLPHYGAFAIREWELRPTDLE